MTHSDADERTQVVQWIFEAECEEYRDKLYQIAQAEQSGMPIDEEFADVLRHCITCASCRRLRQELIYMLKLEAEEGLLTPPAEADAAHVDKPAGAFADEFLRVIQRSANWLVQRTEDGYELWLELTGSLTTSPLGVITRGNNEPQGVEPFAGALTVDDITIEPYQDAEVKVLVFNDTNVADWVTIQVEVNLPARWPNFAGIQVALHGPNGYVQRQTTGQNGIVRFTEVGRDEVPGAHIVVHLPMAG